MTTAAIEVITSHEIASALTRLGRTEDVRFSPSGRRLAIAGFELNTLYVVDLEVAGTGDDLSVILTGMTEVTSGCLYQPHGICFLDDDTVAVANRHAEVPIIRLPPAVPGLRRVDVQPLQTMHADDVHGLKSPGSVVAARLAPDMYEILVCNNYADNVSRHIVDARDGYRVLSSEVIARWALEVPDGVALSEDRRWLAISNHNTHTVLMYRYTASLGPDTKPDGVLENVNYPHGLCFTGDGAHVVVADAGAPYVYVYARGGDDWTGTRQPIATNRVMEDEMYLNGRYNIQEGGPKGIDLEGSMRVLAVSSEYQPLTFFDARRLIPGMGDTARRAPHDGDETAEATRAAMLRALLASAGNADKAAALENALADRDSRVADLEELVAGRDDRIAALEQTVAEQDAVVAGVDERVAEIHQRLAALLAKSEAEANEARIAADYHRRVVVDRDAQLQAMRSSTSWRIMAIPRWILGKARRQH